MDFWDEKTLNCLKNSNLKVDFVGNYSRLSGRSCHVDQTPNSHQSFKRKCVEARKEN